MNIKSEKTRSERGRMEGGRDQEREREGGGNTERERGGGGADRQTEREEVGGRNIYDSSK